MDNGIYQHYLHGTLMQIFPGGLCTAKHLRVDVDYLIIDVIADMNVNNNGFCDMGRCIPIPKVSQLFLK